MDEAGGAASDVAAEAVGQAAGCAAGAGAHGFDAFSIVAPLAAAAIAAPLFEAERGHLHENLPGAGQRVAGKRPDGGRGASKRL